MSKVLIIAEAGVNHNGDINIAKKLIDVAVEAGADIVKFQTFNASKLVSSQAQKADYQIKNMSTVETSQYNMLKKLELTEKDHLSLIEHCQKKGIKFLSTPFDEESIDFLVKLGIKIFKIPSGEITNLPYLRKVGALQSTVILSTGMADLNEIKDAVAVLEEAGTATNRITILHCNTEYPTPMEDVNLNAMLTIKNAFKSQVGYSDHTSGIEVSIAAVALGAVVIEKHFTLSRSMEGPDHKASLEPAELKELIRSIRNIELALGNGCKEPSKSESKNKVIVRKSIHLLKSLPAGHVLSFDDLIMKRPGDGISPMLLDNILGKSLVKALPVDHKLSFENLA